MVRRGAMRQRKLGSHTPPCHGRMVITTLFRRGGGGVTDLPPDAKLCNMQQNTD